MAGMRKRYRTLLILGVIVALIVLLFNAENIRYLFLSKYEYTREANSYGGQIDMEGVIYQEITEAMFAQILQENGEKAFVNVSIGRIDYLGTYRIWKYEIYGRRDAEDRILLKGRDSYVLHDANYPETYFCRQDVLEAWEAEQAE